ncbi:MAG: sigma-70 family RNA polymerase sigma factor [Cyclobacteriaceae bacterium]
MKTRSINIEKLYLECFPVFSRFVSRKGGTLEDARDIFQEALLLYYEKIITEDFTPGISNQAYLIGICKNRYLKAAGKQLNTYPIDQLDIIDQESVATPSVNMLARYLKTSGEKCMQLLQSFYYEKLTMKKVADRFGYATERSATVQKYKCLEKVRETINEKSLTYADFID